VRLIPVWELFQIYTIFWTTNPPTFHDKGGSIMTETAKRELFTRQEEIGTLIEEFPLYIPVTKAAELLHMKPEALRASIEQKRCPFGFCWQLGDRVAYKIPTLTFYQWLMGRAA